MAYRIINHYLASEESHMFHMQVHKSITFGGSRWASVRAADEWMCDCKCAVNFCSSDPLLLFLHQTKQMWQKQEYNQNRLSRERRAPSTSERWDFYLWHGAGSNTEEGRVSMNRIPRETRKNDGERQSDGPNLNKTNEYITGLFYLSPNGFTS